MTAVTLRQRDMLITIVLPRLTFQEQQTGAAAYRSTADSHATKTQLPVENGIKI